MVTRIARLSNRSRSTFSDLADLPLNKKFSASDHTTVRDNRPVTELVVTDAIAW